MHHLEQWDSGQFLCAAYESWHIEVKVKRPDTRVLQNKNLLAIKSPGPQILQKNTVKQLRIVLFPNV